jgi:integrase/recombinase XerD
MQLFEAVETYIDRKRSLGVIFEKSALNLRSFSKRVGDVPLETITPGQILAFLNGPRSSTVTWRVKYNLLKHFLEYWAARGMLHALPMPVIRPPVPRTFVPYIYTRNEVRILLRTARVSQRLATCSIDSATLRIFLVFLYATGALVGEALGLLREDVDLKNGAITIRRARFNRSRTIPIGPDLQTKLRRHVTRLGRNRMVCPHFFLDKQGKAMSCHTLRATFQKLRRVAGILRQDGAVYQPRMHDLRYTFAVHRLTSWFKQGADMNRLLPALAAYIGQVGLGSTERYLSLTPERFRKQLVKLSPQHRKKRRWRDNPALMRFLAEL